ncbi:primosomal protein DnaI [Priestia filamentosa]|uniref:Primosomal protein DnaI n=1 Tax=Priestia filamentosa TaxID=1402861 RepID=A0A1X7CSD6_9BACI|nr:primosomal protein DnaI [Priestia filamentosa]AKO94371.1 primosomal protein DnaI [Priestia filamentosa]MDT3764657.1 primosomal protein DnaI [Priestia filamentosa]OXS70897.1 primosomal protein DnaI [Priestia filamentosa]RJS66530.1 primosomal protein DnaI [Priestia filamentosa]WCM15261.1 primosomal protein DnaI [Priestia filamentosa]
MQPIDRSLKKVMQKPDFKTRLSKMRMMVTNQKEVQEFLQEHRAEIDDKMIDRSLMKMYEYTTQSKQCKNCPSLDQCINLVKGYEPKLTLQGKTIDLQYDRCPNKIAHDQEKEYKTLIKSLHLPREILDAKMGNIDMGRGRAKALTLVHEFLQNYENGKPAKGLYIYGSFGVGKTYFLGAIANELAKRNIQSILVYLPEFLRELKNSLKDSSLGEKIELVKTAPILMLDDIGAEAMSSWVRDDIIGTILQYRMHQSLPTFFTSNLGIKELTHHFTYSQRGEEEALKAARIVERVKALATPVNLVGENRREQK